MRWDAAEPACRAPEKRLPAKLCGTAGPKAVRPGGGVSNVFPKPAYQAATNVPPSPGGAGGRGVPDVAGNAAAESPYKVRVDGQDTRMGHQRGRAFVGGPDRSPQSEPRSPRWFPECTDLSAAGGIQRVPRYYTGRQ